MPLRISTLQAKIISSGLTTMLLLVVGLFAIFWRTWIAADLERAQRRFAGVASVVAREMKPALTPVVDERKLIEIANQFRTFNPTMDLYLIDEQGTVLSGFTVINRGHPLGSVPLETLKTFLAAGDTLSLPFYGPDPLAPGRKTVFSAAPLTLDGAQYYVYAVLANSSATHLGNLFMSTVAVRWALATSLVLVLASILLGRMLIAPTMNRFGRVVATVVQLARRDYTARVDDNQSDELGHLGKSINEMAAELGAHVEELQRKDERRRELIANIWHDVRTPVAGVSALAQSLQHMSVVGGDGSEAMIESLVANAALLGRILSDLRELGRLELGDHQPELERVSLAAIADELYLAYRPVAEKYGITLHLVTGDGLRRVNADRVMISRVGSNLIENALRYTPSGGEVHLLVEGSDTSTSLVVEDNGTGIDPGDLPHIFDREFQSPHQSADLRGASGLGLAIVKKIIEAHGGHIAVESAAGAGTRFVVTLPRA